MVLSPDLLSRSSVSSAGYVQGGTAGRFKLGFFF